jgi:predicted extracellular nuclease
MKNKCKYTSIIASILLLGLVNSCAAPSDEDTGTSEESTKQNNNVTAPADNTEGVATLYNIGFYNVENLFDTKDDPNTQDEWFLPSSKTKWDDKKYNKKLKDLAKVIDALNDEKGGPDILGLCEVENKQVVEDLINEKSLSKKNYQVVHYESPDIRGIDVAMIFDADLFDLISSESIEVEMPENAAVKTRDILYCQLKAKSNSEIIHFYTNHWSSRRNGENESYYKRKNCALALTQHMDEMQLDFNTDNLIIVGDMNDYPDNKSIYDVLGAKEMDSKGELHNLQYQNHKNGKGTYNYKGEWGCLDNVIVSNALMDNLSDTDATIFDQDWIMYFNKSGEPSPNKTYGGSKYYGGYSDHLPVYVDINL